MSTHPVMAAARLLGPWGWAAVAAVLIAAAATFNGLLPLASAIAAPSSESAAAADTSPRIESFRASIEKSLARFNGRSAFFVPPAPPPPPPPPSDDRDEPPPPPSRYAGPGIIAMINDTVWFDNGERLSLDDAARAGIRVIAIHPPWSATLEWNEKEWEVPLFTRTTPLFLEQPEQQPEPQPDPETPEHD